MGDTHCFANYRPISLLANFSKFFEKVMYNRLLEFIEKHDILYSSHAVWISGKAFHLISYYSLSQ